MSTISQAERSEATRNESSPLLGGGAAINGGKGSIAEVVDVKEPYWCRCCCFDVFPILLLIGIAQLTLGGYFVYDTPGAIQTQLTEYFKHGYSSADNLALYTVYSAPNTVLAFFGGIIVDRYTGVRVGAVLFAGLILLGQGIFLVGIIFKSYPVALLGRFVYGLGGENVTVVQNTLTVRWFKKTGKLALVMGLIVAYSRVGSSINFVVTPILADKSVILAVAVGTGICLLSFLFAIYVGLMDYTGRRRIASTIHASDTAEVISIKHISRFPLSAWLVFAICAFFYIAILTFYAVASDILQNTGKKYAPARASLFISIPSFVSIGASPTFGRLVDVYGKALYAIALASTVLIGVHIGFFLVATEVVAISPIVLMVILGLAYSLGASSLWPIVSFVIPPSMQGTAYGLMTSVQNTGLALAPLVVGLIQDRYSHSRKQYTLPLLLFVSCAGIALILTLILIPIDRKRTQGRLNMSAKERAKLAAFDYQNPNGDAVQTVS